MKKRTIVALILAALSLAMLTFVGACEKDDPDCVWSNEWSYDGEKHWHACMDEGCEEVSDEAVHSGGTATCTAKAVCATCGQEYGELNPANHASEEFEYTANNDGTHKKVYACCKVVAAENEACSGGAATCMTKAVCEYCNAEYGTTTEHTWSTEWSFENGKHWLTCTTAGCTAKSQEAACAGGTATCTAKAACTTCGHEYGELNPANHASEEFKYTANNDGTHKKVYACCKVVADQNEACSGGAATCMTKAVCEHCNTEYGGLSSDHAWSTEWSFGENQHWHACTVQGCTAKTDEAACAGGTATCIEKATCATCGNKYGELSAEHAYADGIDSSDEVYDYNKCVCGKLDRDHGFKKTVDVKDQELYLNKTTIALDLTGVSAYESVKSITLGETSLGTNAGALNFGAIKEDAEHHGATTINVIVTDANGNDHEVSVSAILVTQLITTDDELKTLLYHGQPETARYGYFVLGNDIVYTGTRNYAKFFGTFDGNGHSIFTTDILNGLFTYTMNTAVIKNLTIKATLNPAVSNYRTVLANSAYNSKFINVTVIYESGVDSSVLNGCGFLFRNDCHGVTFEGLTVSAVGKKISSLLGTNLKNPKFSNCTVYADEVVCLAGKADGTEMVGFDSVTGIEHKTIQPAEIKLWQENPSVAYEFGDKVITDIICGNYSFGSNANSLVVPEELIADKSKHGVNMLCFKFEDGSSVYLPTILVTAEITNKNDFFAAVQCASGDYTEKFGYYKLANDIEFNQNVNGGVFNGADSDARNDGLVGFRGTIDGNGHTLKTIGAAKVYNGGFFGLIGKDAVIKNVKFNVAMASGAYGLIGSHGYLATIQDVEVTLTETQTNIHSGVFFAFFSGSMSYKRVTVNAVGLDLQTIFGVKVGYSILPSCEDVVVNAKSLVAACKKGWEGDLVQSITGFKFNVVE